MKRLVAAVYLYVVERAVRVGGLDISAAAVARATDQITEAINEFWHPTVTNHVIGESPVGDATNARVASPTGHLP